MGHSMEISRLPTARPNAAERSTGRSSKSRTRRLDMTIYEKWGYKEASFDLKTDDDAGIEDLRQAMIKAGAFLIMHRET